MKNLREERFIRALTCVTGAEKVGGIGTLGEKTVHGVLKHYLEPDETLHEVKVNGFVADICTPEGIIEIQTRSFHKLYRKLEAFLPEYPVTVVYPLIRRKDIYWIDPETGEVSKGRKSNKEGKLYHILPELYLIRRWLTHEHFRLMIILLETEEYRHLDGWSSDRKRGAARIDQIPKRIVEEITFTKPEDYEALLPPLPEGTFTAKDLMSCTRFRSRKASYALHALLELGLIRRAGEQGRAYLYEKV